MPAKWGVHFGDRDSALLARLESQRQPGESNSALVKRLLQTTTPEEAAGPRAASSGPTEAQGVLESARQLVQELQDTLDELRSGAVVTAAHPAFPSPQEPKPGTALDTLASFGDLGV